MKEKFITKERLDKMNLHERICKYYKITPDILKEILLGLEIDVFISKHKFVSMSDKIKKLWGIDISPRSLRYIYKYCKNYEEVYEKVKKGGKIRGTYAEHLRRDV